MIFNNKSAVQLLIYSALLVAGFISGWKVNEYYENPDARNIQSKTVVLGHHKLLNPLLACEVAETTLRRKQLKPFKNRIKRLIAEKISAGMATEISVYFRDLDDGKVLSIDGDNGFAPASLSKVPVMIAYLKLAEDAPNLLTKRIYYDGKKDTSLKQQFRPRKTLEAGKSYTVDDLIFRMIAYSDNNAFDLLLENIDLNYMNKMVAELGAEFVEGPGGEPLITVKSYSLFFRVLYNASFLNMKMSQKALEYLAIEEFPLGIIESVPTGITVASKFAEITSGVNGEIKMLHNFGIVYHPKQPYLVCIMSKGSDFNQLATVIRDISKIIYEEVESQTRGQ